MAVSACWWCGRVHQYEEKDLWNGEVVCQPCRQLYGRPLSPKKPTSPKKGGKVPAKDQSDASSEIPPENGEQGEKET
jgi:hypothetical protein